jgi:YD repeat-containing protein
MRYDVTEVEQEESPTTVRPNRRRNARVVGRVVRDVTDSGESVKIEYDYFDKKTGATLASSSAVL